MKLIRRKIAIIFILAYVFFSLYAAYNVFFNKKVITRVHRVVKKGSAPAGMLTVISSLACYSHIESVACRNRDSSGNNFISVTC